MREEDSPTPNRRRQPDFESPIDDIESLSLPGFKGGASGVSAGDPYRGNLTI